MSKRFVYSINNMRGLCMLGVIAIHIGSIALTNPYPNIWLIGILEILSRYSVPAFFFLSAFGLFYNHPLTQSFSYLEYIKKRLKTVLIPYLTWSLFYLLYTATISHQVQLLYPLAILKSLWYGLGMYHLYFLVILLWFYLLMPVWRYLLTYINQYPRFIMPLLFISNVLFNYYSSYIWITPAHSFWHDAIAYRLNYLIFHYLFIFLFGAFVATYWQIVLHWLHQHGKLLCFAQLVTTVGMISAYLGVMHAWHYDPLSAVFTIHQLSPIGMCYTVSTLLFCLYIWECHTFPSFWHTFFQRLGDASYPIYLIHPLFLSMGTGLLNHYHIIPSTRYILLLYVSITLLSYIYASILGKISLPSFLRLCLQGK